MKNPIVTAIFDYVVEISGNYEYQQNQIFCLKNSKQDIKMMLISSTTDRAFCLASAGVNDLLIGSEVVAIHESEKVKTPKDIFGKIININNDVLYPINEKFTQGYYKHENNIFNNDNKLLDYEPLEQQLYTGYINIDLLIPIGRGQRELIIGDRRTGKTHIALNTIINQKGKGIKCIYVAIGQQQSQVTAAYKLLKENGAMDYTVIIDASSSNPYEQYLAPYIGMAHAENICPEEDVLIVFDNLTNHANIIREIALLTNKPVGKEAFPGDMFYAHSRLLERSGKFKNKYSITALPIIQTIENDITSLVASNVISITDGQIVTNSELFAAGKIPAVDIDLSVSRIGGNVQKAHIARVASEVGKLYKSYKRQIKLSSLKYDLNDDISQLISNGILAERMFIQKGVSSYSENAMFMTSKLVTWGFLSEIKDLPLVLKFVDKFIEKNKQANELFNNLLSNKQNNDEIAKNFFKYSLDQFSKANKLDWKLNSNDKFLPLDQSKLVEIYNEITGVK
ncbi:ATP F0F1 synthase subunit alpha [Mycoplasmopsis pullorum]|uniref:MSC_0619 family F1-like ATPase alpha subunit n=2 Tax=Mycoplasmopsis pullorum TaxID=48003 RepID=UPI001117FCFC|nr:ATP F0F1 synthase subunit alpha [Mycoplasmopsis pullorum]TNK81746.1 ATP F0F1 synthase subunit alpha [Mycoplasmopsis pullorum]TNK83075.1 ATP F0F1 synthase subunit alpha [Mycoplasmopsis pullorum]TNK85006.1 ATP F0F1 synthase subunit alpha [Mycoplasmopsis pullorum]TNK85607.1 ATP F0F1 synthase subunit alpha [Mycoplasmopsis pullorum]TNK86387.1 ATP F0F1 synthase subunit alpha [Mycoplasmopsis pullorum]